MKFGVGEEFSKAATLLTYRVSTLKVEHRQLTLCIQFIDIMPLFRYIKKNFFLFLRIKLPMILK
jgi:hypothetical protein